jgi:hypothetical protein
MASFFRTKVSKDIGTTPVDVLETSSGSRFTLIGCNLANTTDEVVIVDVTITDASAITGYYIKQLVIEPYTSAKIVTNGEKIILAENTTMTVVSDTAASIDLIASYAEIV